MARAGRTSKQRMGENSGAVGTDPGILTGKRRPRQTRNAHSRRPGGPPMKCRLVVPALLVLAAAARSAEPTKLDLFEAGKGGYELYRIPGVVATPRGTLLAY